LKLLVIGCGSIGSRHAVNASKVAEVGVFDEDSVSAKKISSKLKIVRFSDLQSAFGWYPDGVIIATPTHTHADICMSVLDAGFSVLTEKPITNDLSKAVSIVDRAEELKLDIFVVCNMRFHLGVSTIIKNLHKIGNPFFARAHVGSFLPNRRPDIDYRLNYSANKSMGGGVVLDAIHEIDYLTNCFGKVTKVKSMINKLSNMEIDVEDYAEIIMVHEENVHVSIHMDYLRYFKRRGCEIVGDKGMLLWQSEGKNPEICNVRFFPNGGSNQDILADNIKINSNSMYEELIRNFCSALKGENNELLNGKQALEQLSIVQKIKEESEFN